MFKFRGMDEEFFRLFAETAATLHRAALALQYTCNHYDTAPEGLKNLAELKLRVERTTEAIIEKLGATFITPFDREDIYSLARWLNEIAVSLYLTAETLLVYDPGRPGEHFLKLLEVLVTTIATLKTQVTALPGLKKNAVAILRLARAIKKYRDQGDGLYHEGLGEMYRSCRDYYTAGQGRLRDLAAAQDQGLRDLLAVLKWQRVFDQVYVTLRECAAVASLLQGIVMKYV
ncbi:DUF47 domain-containing protein [Moorella sp. Hama-1]|uniref:DUF47 domain-containing protein n=1 Tax=Moorella sp. Hama-1 TaxID=2138101 RepID=UPI000D656E37|nr:DUF47 family protein [Moorella sp. Hama-1]MDN5362184.1 uncharacterized protein [Moorella sp. (in: firmicutes)]BCV21367.1 phosphate transport regulator [Moorella sp. Hama-1]